MKYIDFMNMKKINSIIKALNRLSIKELMGLKSLIDRVLEDKLEELEKDV